MVDTRSPDQVILVFSTLPVEVMNATLQRLDGISGSLCDGSDLTWHVDNRYYAVDLRIRSLKDRSRLLERAREGAPAVVLIQDSSKAIQRDFFDSLDATSIDVPLVVGTHVDAVAQSAEDQSLICLDYGWEYIDIDHTAEDATEQSGIARFSEALQAHAWPGARMKSSRSGGKTSFIEAEAASLYLPSPQTGFDDDFAPFVSADSLSNRLDVTETDGDAENAQEKMAALFAQLANMRDQALSMPNDDRRRDFAADVALRFAKHLDSMDDQDT